MHTPVPRPNSVIHTLTFNAYLGWTKNINTWSKHWLSTHSSTDSQLVHTPVPRLNSVIHTLTFNAYLGWNKYINSWSNNLLYSNSRPNKKKIMNQPILRHIHKYLNQNHKSLIQALTLNPFKHWLSTRAHACSKT